MFKDRISQVVCVLFVIGAAILVPMNLASIWEYKALEGSYRAYLMRYEPDAYSTRPQRHKHAIVRITFADDRQVEFRSSQSGSIEWLPSGEPLKILIRQPQGRYGRTEYEVNHFAHLYSDSLFLGGMALAFVLGAVFWPRPGEEPEEHKVS